MGLQSKTTPPHKLGVLADSGVKVSSSLITLSPRFEGLKVAAVPRGKRDLTVFDFRMYLNPDRTETGDFVGPLSEVVFGSTRPFHRWLVSIKRFK